MTFNKWDYRYMDLAEIVAKWSTCAKANRHVGAIIVKNGGIVSTGHNGAPSKHEHCSDVGCMKIKFNDENMCIAIHAEQNAITQAAKLGESIDGATMYCTHRPCGVCSKLIINAGIQRVIYRHEYPDSMTDYLVDKKLIDTGRIE